MSPSTLNRLPSNAHITSIVTESVSSVSNRDGNIEKVEEEVATETSIRQRRTPLEPSAQVQLVEEIKVDKADGETKVTTTFTLRFEELLPWQMDNVYILSGYRRLQHTYTGCLKSLFYLHNETGNIFSHLLGALGFIAAFFPTYLYTIHDIDTLQFSDKFVIAIFLASAITCLGLSAFFHTCICHSRDVCVMWNKADYVGIVVLICGSYVPTCFYGFYCSRTLKIVYLTMIGIFGFMTLVGCVSNHFSTPEYRIIRTSSFVALGLSGVVPLVHATIQYGFYFVSHSLQFWYLFTMALLYLVGALIYASRVPERWYPGKFDIWGHSHQIFHLLVVAAATVHYFGVTSALRFWHKENPTCAEGIESFIKRLNAI